MTPWEIRNQQQPGEPPPAYPVVPYDAVGYPEQFQPQYPQHPQYPPPVMYVPQIVPMPVPVYMPPPTPKVSGMAVASMVLGILSLLFGLFLWPVVLAVLAVVFGHVASSTVRNSNGWATGRGMAIAGLVCGYITLGFWIIVVVIAVLTASSASPFI